jgi:hypothetical protein
MLTFNAIHNNFLGILEKKIPEKQKLIEMLMDLLSMEKGAIYRRLRGDVPFSFYEVARIAQRLDISIYNLIYPDSVKIDRFDLNIIEYTNMCEADYKQWEDYTAMISMAQSDPLSELAESSNVLPINIYAKYDSLVRFYLFKYTYLFSGTERRTSFHDIVIPERLREVFRLYYTVTKDFAKTVYIWDYMIFQYLATDIHFFSSIDLISKDDIGHIKEDLFALLSYIEQIAINGCFEETGNTVSFYISDVNLDGDYSYLQIKDMNLSLVRSFILNSVVSGDKSSFDKTKDWVNSIKKSSILITQTGAVFRADFFETQRKIIAEL